MMTKEKIINIILGEDAADTRPSFIYDEPDDTDDGNDCDEYAYSSADNMDDGYGSCQNSRQDELDELKRDYPFYDFTGVNPDGNLSLVRDDAAIFTDMLLWD